MSKVLIFDTETGGLTPDFSVLSLGALAGDLETGEVSGAFECLVKLPSYDDYNVTPKAMEINKLDIHQCMEEGQTPEEVGDALMDLWTSSGAAQIGGHNVEYDVRMTAANIFQCTPAEFEANFTYRKLDSLPVVSLMQGVGNWKSGRTLTQAVKAMSIDTAPFKDQFKDSYRYTPRTKGFHTALFDSWCCFMLLYKFRQVIGLPENVERLQS